MSNPREGTKEYIDQRLKEIRIALDETDSALLALGPQLAKQVEAYNQQNPARPIRFLHGSSSAVFSYMGREVHTSDDKEKKIPRALIPTGQLRKEYGVYPISGELLRGAFGDRHARRKEGVNYIALSGMEPTAPGIRECLTYAHNYSNRFVASETIHREIESMIQDMSGKNYISTLKMLVLQVTNLMLMDPNAGGKADYYLKLLDDKFNVLKNQGGHDAEFERRFKKYYGEIADRLHGKKYAFKSDKQFIEEIKNQFPIVICSSVTSKPANSTGEIKHSGNIDLQAIHIIFTPDEHVQTLQGLLKHHQAEHIRVVGFNNFFQRRLQLFSEENELVRKKAALNQSPSELKPAPPAQVEPAPNRSQSEPAPNRSAEVLSAPVQRLQFLSQSKTPVDILIERTRKTLANLESEMLGIGTNKKRKLKKIQALTILEFLANIQPTVPLAEHVSAVRKAFKNAGIEEGTVSTRIKKLFEDISRMPPAKNFSLPTQKPIIDNYLANSTKNKFTEIIDTALEKLESAQFEPGVDKKKNLMEMKALTVLSFLAHEQPAALAEHINTVKQQYSGNNFSSSTRDLFLQVEGLANSWAGYRA